MNDAASAAESQPRSAPKLTLSGTLLCYSRQAPDAGAVPDLGAGGHWSTRQADIDLCRIVLALIAEAQYRHLPAFVQ